MNKRTRTTATLIGILLALSGIVNHGLFEILQGNVSTNGYYIEAIGEAHRFWIYGTEGAFTVIHNFLITGISVVLAGLAIILWSVKYLHVKYGTTVFLLLFILMTLFGGGIGYIIMFVPTWAYATQINKPLNWWKKVLPEWLRKKLSALWIYSLVATAVFWLILLELGIFGYFPGQNDPDVILNFVFVVLFSSVFMTSITFICAFAGDIEVTSL